MRCVVGLGSNLGERWARLGAAVAAIAQIDPQLVVSSVYETDPVGGPDGQGPYLNCAIAFSTTLSPRELLEMAHRLEQQAGRVRTERWGPRTLDVDLLDVGGMTRAEPDLTLPHPRWTSRAFVVVPLEEVAPDLLDAGWRERLGGSATISAAVRRVGVLLPAPPVGEPR